MQRVTIDPAFSIVLPAGWLAEADEDEGVLVSAPSGPGLLHLISFPNPPEEAMDPADELYAFLEEQGVEIEEDEVEDRLLEDGAELSFCEYLAEGDEDGDTTYWLVGVATAPGNLVFVSYSCQAGEEEAERDALQGVLASLRLHRAP